MSAVESAPSHNPEAEDEDRFADLRGELASLLNRWSMENGCNTPDHILAEYLLRCLGAFDTAVNERANWYGRHDEPGQAMAGTA